MVVTFLLALAEGLSRLAPAARPVEIADYVARWDADWDGEFWMLEPGRGVNRNGFRDRDRSPTKP